MARSVIGAQLYTVRDFVRTPGEVDTAFARLREIGYEAVQVSGLGPIEPAQLRALADKHDLQIVATHIGFEDIVNDPCRVIAEHRLWGCRHVAIGGMPAGYRSADGFARFARDADEAVKPLIDAGLTFSYHNHSFELERFGTRTGLDILYEDSTPERFSAEIDTYWIQHGGANPVSWLKRLRGRMHLVHFKDMAVINGQPVYAEVGEGNLEWPSIIDACREAGVQWYLVEQDTCRRDPFDSLALSLRNLRALGLH